MEGTRGICVQCGCHLENCFRFCPKCGMQLIVHKEVNGLGGGGNSQVRCLNVSNVPQTRLLQSKSIATPAPSSSSSARTFQTAFKLPGFHACKSSKEKGDLIFVGKKRRSDTLRLNQLSFWLRLWVLTRNQSDVRP